MRAEDNKLLTQVGPGSPMGSFMREYWLPAYMTSEVEADGAPLRVKLLGEKLIAFKTKEGRYALMDHICPHRCASLFFGRNEEEGIRCVYHGWKFDIDGQCIDMPSEPPETDFKNKIRVKAYPCVERGGMVWAYMGTRETPPPLPLLNANRMPENNRNIWASLRECNWLQGLEGDIDTSHFGFLHAGGATLKQADSRNTQIMLTDKAPKYEVLDREYGTMYGAYRPAEGDNVLWRVAQYLFPFWTMSPGSLMEEQLIARAWVPIDDGNVMFYHFGKKGAGPSNNKIKGSKIHGLGGEVKLKPHDPTSWLGRFRLESNAENEYLIDRDVQQSKSYSGIDTGHIQDTMVTETMGVISDRTKEHLGTSDKMVSQTRRRIIKAVKHYTETGETPKSVNDPLVYHKVTSGMMNLPKEADWLAEAEIKTDAMIKHYGLELKREELNT